MIAGLGADQDRGTCGRVFDFGQVGGACENYSHRLNSSKNQPIWFQSIGVFNLTTSALALNQILSSVSRAAKNVKFTTAVADQLGLDGLDAEPEAVKHLYLLVERVKRDIEGLPFDDVLKKQAMSMITPFNGLANFGHIHMDIANSKANFLKPENLVGLTNLHMTLTGHVEYSDLPPETKKIADEFRELRDAIQAVNFPPRLKEVLQKRVSQIISMLENFYFFGADALQQEIEALVGAMVINPPNKGDKAEGVFSRMTAAITLTLKGLKTVDKGMGTVLAIEDKGEALMEIVTSLADKG